MGAEPEPVLTARKASATVLCVADASGQQLGNRLFLFAHLIACSREQGLTLVHPFFHPYADHFTGTADDLFCRYPARRSWPRPSASRRQRLQRWFAAVRPVVERWATSGPLRQRIGLLESGGTTTLADPHGEYDLDGPGFREVIARKRLLLVKGPLHRAHRSIRKHSAAIREHFRPVPGVAEEASRTMARARARGATVVGVHVRQGDYRSFVDGKYFFTTAQYRDLMVRVAPQFGEEKVVFLVCSDQAPQAEAFAGLRVVLGGAAPAADLYALAQCDFLMGPPSTYSGWSSFYGSVPHYRILDVGRTPSRQEFTPVSS